MKTTEYENFASVLKHAEGGLSIKSIKASAKRIGVKVQVYPGPYVGHHGISIDKKATKKQRREMLEAVGLKP